MGNDKRPPDATAEVEASKAPDPFSPEALRLRQDYPSMVDVKPILTTVPVRKPNRQEFVRVHPDDGYQLTTALLEQKNDREYYLVTFDLWEDLVGELVPVKLFTAITRQRVVFLWPCRLPDETGRTNPWWDSGLEAANLAMEKWVRVKSDNSLGAYRIFAAKDQLPDPEWPDVPLGDLLKIAFQGKTIDSLDHPVLKGLRGET